MKNIKKLLALTLSLLMIISALPLTVGAADEVIQWKASYTKEQNPDIYYTVILDDGSVGIKTDIGDVYGAGAVLGEWTNRYITYDVTPTYSGTYVVEVEAATNEARPNYLHAYADGVEIGTLYIADGGWITYTKGFRKVGTVTAKAGTPIKLAFNNPRTDISTDVAYVLLGQIRLTYLAPAELEASSIDDGATVARSTDVITLDFSRELDNTKLEDAKVTLTDSKSNELALSLEADGDKLNVLLNESLKYEESYKLIFSDIKDSLGASTNEEIINFNTAAKDSDLSTDNASVSITADAEGTVFTVSGTVFGSKGQGIAGRNVTISVTSPLGNDTKVIDTVTSAKDGVFELNYTLAQEDEENGGVYTFTAAAEHAALPGEGTARYISESQKLALLGTLEGYTSAGDIETFLATGSNAADLGADIASLSELTDDSLFYDRLAKASYKNGDGEYDIKVFEKVWNTSYALEMVNQKDSNDVTVSYLEDADFASAISLDLDKYSALDEQKDELITAVTGLARQETAEAFGKAVNELINEYLLIENDKTDLILSLSDASAYVGETAVVELKLTAKASDISEYTIDVDCASGGVAEDVVLDAPEGASVSKNVAGSVASFVVTNVSGELSNLGNLEYASSSARTEDIAVSGAVIYDVDGLPINAVIAKAEAEIKIKKNESKGGSGKTSGFAPSTTVKPQTQLTPPAQDDNSPEDEIFADISDVPWAQESIELLCKKGIISEASDGKFRPNDSVTRAEFVKMLTVAMRITDKSAPVKLADVSQSDWYYTYVAAAVNYGLVLGDDKGNFRPNDKITRQDICVIVSRAMDKLGYGDIAQETAPFSDDYMISDYAKSAVYRMRNHEIVNGTGDGSFAPLSDATRAATAKIIDTFMKEAKI